MKTKNDSIKNIIRTQVIQAAKNYTLLAGKLYLYVYGNEYFEVLFSVGSFKHLTGIGSALSAVDFYQKAASSKLSENQLIFNQQHTVKKAKKKLPCLLRLPELTNSTVCVVKDLTTQTLLYKLGVTNLDFTLGMAQPAFINKLPDGVYLPRSLRVKDKAIENSTTGEFIDFIFEKPTNRKDYQYDIMTYRGTDNRPPDCISHLIDSSFYK